WSCVAQEWVVRHNAARVGKFPVGPRENGPWLSERAYGIRNVSSTPRTSNPYHPRSPLTLPPPFSPFFVPTPKTLVESLVWFAFSIDFYPLIGGVVTSRALGRGLRWSMVSQPRLGAGA